SASSSASVPFATAMQCALPQYRANALSNCSTVAPPIKTPWLSKAFQPAITSASNTATRRPRSSSGTAIAHQARSVQIPCIRKKPNSTLHTFIHAGQEGESATEPETEQEQ